METTIISNVISFKQILLLFSSIRTDKINYMIPKISLYSN